MYEKLKKCVEVIRKRTDFQPRMAIVLGSGLGGYADAAQIETEISYGDIDGFPVSTVAGHEGKFIFGYVGKVPVVMMQGRVHYYEGYDMAEVVLPIRLMGMLGAEDILLTNAAGGIREEFTPGDLMLITDHISTFVPSPLRGANIEELGVRFPDMSRVYDRDLMDKVRRGARMQNISLKEGVYLQAPGPNYETPAEIRMFRTLGADAVGMSTVCEAIAARHMGMNVCGISCITNMAAGILNRPLNHEEVQQTADLVKDKVENLVTAVICA
ncbi:MAG: purine-nucleoside phosphorylase [Ruminococcus sp.]|jgi:purine-nucleoside phosphorylase